MKTPSKDHRTRVTKMLIRRAFTELLRQKPIQSISIKELCETAGVNRGTFYALYRYLRPAEQDGGGDVRGLSEGARTSFGHRGRRADAR
ncbi:MAG: TetR/AcrR family transcriptional regulator [Oscillospiraceae bacterium]